MVATEFHIARALDVEPYQLHVFPGENVFHRLVDLTRLISDDDARELIAWIEKRYEAPPVEAPIAKWREAIASPDTEPPPKRRASRPKKGAAKKRG